MADWDHDENIDRFLHEEIEVLESIYIEELSVSHDERGCPSAISLQLHPATGEEVDKKYVCMTLRFEIPIDYPDRIPEIKIRNPRGIAEEEIQSLHADMVQLAEDRSGGPMLFEIIELAKECLTEGNIPHCLCTICYEHFLEGDSFTKTDCYHYFHHDCLSRYITHTLKSQAEELENQPLHQKGESDQEEKVLCPVCRENIAYNPEILTHETPVDVSNADFILPQDVRIWQKEMAELLEKQKQRGGIIDLEAEKNKYLLSPDETIVIPRSLSPSSGVNSKDEKTKEKEKERSGIGRERMNDDHGYQTNKHNYYKGTGRGNRLNDSKTRGKYFDVGEGRIGRYRDSNSRKNARRSNHDSDYKSGSRQIDHAYDSGRSQRQSDRDNDSGKFSRQFDHEDDSKKSPRLPDSDGDSGKVSRQPASDSDSGRNPRQSDHDYDSKKSARQVNCDIDSRKSLRQPASEIDSRKNPRQHDFESDSRKSQRQFDRDYDSRKSPRQVDRDYDSRKSPRQFDRDYDSRTSPRQVRRDYDSRQDSWLSNRDSDFRKSSRQSDHKHDPSNKYSARTNEKSASTLDEGKSMYQASHDSENKHCENKTCKTSEIADRDKSKTIATEEVKSDRDRNENFENKVHKDDVQKPSACETNKVVSDKGEEERKNSVDEGLSVKESSKDDRNQRDGRYHSQHRNSEMNPKGIRDRNYGQRYDKEHGQQRHSEMNRREIRRIDQRDGREHGQHRNSEMNRKGNRDRNDQRDGREHREHRNSEMNQVEIGHRNDQRDGREHGQHRDSEINWKGNRERNDQRYSRDHGQHRNSEMSGKANRDRNDQIDGREHGQHRNSEMNWKGNRDMTDQRDGREHGQHRNSEMNQVEIGHRNDQRDGRELGQHRNSEMNWKRNRDRNDQRYSREHGQHRNSELNEEGYIDRIDGQRNREMQEKSTYQGNRDKQTMSRNRGGRNYSARYDSGSRNYRETLSHDGYVSRKNRDTFHQRENSDRHENWDNDIETLRTSRYSTKTDDRQKSFSVKGGGVVKEENWDIELQIEKLDIKDNKDDGALESKRERDNNSRGGFKTEQVKRMGRGRGRGKHGPKTESKVDRDSSKLNFVDDKKSAEVKIQTVQPCDNDNTDNQGISISVDNGEISVKNDSGNLKIIEEGKGLKKHSTPPGFVSKRPPPGFDNVISDDPNYVKPPPGFGQADANS